MQFFYAVLGLVWLIAAVYLYLYDPSRNIILSVIYIIVGLAIEVLAYFYPKLFLGKYIKLSDSGIYALLPSQKDMKLKWEDINTININDKSIDIRTKKQDTLRLELKDMYDVEWKNLSKVLSSLINERHLS